MTAKTYKNEFAEPMIKGQKNILKKHCQKRFKDGERYYRHNNANDTLHREINT